MSGVSVIRRIARIAKSIIINDERASMVKRIELSQQQVDRRVRLKKRKIRQEGYRLMMDETGMSEEELREKFHCLRELKITAVTLFLYRVYGLYKMSEGQALNTLQAMKEKADLEDEIKWDLRQVDLGRKSYEELSERISEAKDKIRKLLTSEAKMEIAAKAGYLNTGEMAEKEIEDIAVDMEFTRSVLRYAHDEYAAFHFYEKPLAERRTFIGDEEKRKILKAINSEESIGILDDKLMTYERLKNFYGRDMISIGSEKDYLRFKKFFDKNDEAVIKPRFESLGKGISLIRRDDIENRWKLFIDLIDEHRRFLVEGYIRSAEEMKVFNPDSVNTVRIICYCDGKDVSIRSASMRIGHAGSFIDNLGAGGITVSVDKEKGIIISDGIDEAGVVYEKHPDTGIKFKGVQLPAWSNALETVRSAADMIDGARYVGWDLACTSEYKWVIVEGNSKTGFFGAQAPLGIGKRQELFEIIKKEPSDPMFSEIAVKMAREILEEDGIPLEETIERLRNFEQLGLDGRFFKSGRAWELTNEECIRRFAYKKEAQK